VTSSTKPEVHNTSQRRQRRIEPHPQGICTTNFVKIGPALPEICSRTDRPTDKLIAEYCNQPVCLSVREHISGTAGPIFAKFCVQIPRGFGSVLLWRRCDTLCTSGCVDDVTFGRTGPYGETWGLNREGTTTSGVAIPGRSVMSMNACFLLHTSCLKCNE